jgi:NitT/TauT family transport system substrate-binding protein
MKKFILNALLVAILCLLFQSCSHKINRIRVGYLPIAECLPLYVAKEKGFFEKYGLEVELVSESGGPSVFKELDAGSIDIGFSNVVTLIKHNNAGKNFISIFGATYETEININHAIFGRNDRITRLNDHSRFGINARNNIEELMLLHFLEGRGINLSRDLLTHFVEIPFPQMLSSLGNKNIDFACVVEPAITIAKNDSSSFLYMGNHYSSSKSSKVLVATYVSKETTLDLRKSEIDNFILAMTESTTFINSFNSNSRDFIKKYSKIDDKLLNKISLPEFSAKIDETSLNEIIEMMYSETLNFNKSFILNPENRISTVKLIYRNE